MLLCPIESLVRVTQHFAQHPQDYAKYGLRGHDGADLTGPEAGVSVPVYAPCDGIILLTEHLPGYGAYGKGVLVRSTPDKLGRSREVILGHHASISAIDGQYI